MKTLKKFFGVFLPVLGAVLAIAMVIHAIRWGNLQMENSRRDYFVWQMEHARVR